MMTAALHSQQHCDVLLSLFGAFEKAYIADAICQPESF